VFVTYQWIKEFVEVDWSPEEIANQLTMAGLEVEDLQQIGQIPEKILVGKVFSVNRHPSADRLTICGVSLGDRKVEVICGAPNVAEGQLVPVALPGAVLGEGFKIRKTKIRGVTSEGMICSEKELGVSGNHEGIMVLNSSHIPGEPFKLPSEELDYVFDIFVTPNRPDCMSVMGIAREIGALSNKRLRIPEITIIEEQIYTENEISIEIKDTRNCPRYLGRVIKDVKIGPSPNFIAKRLNAVGIRSINNVVDITNYVLMETGQPLHAFDLVHIAGKRIVVRLADKNEKFVTLDGIKRELTDETLLICDAERPVALAGIMGGLNSEVTETTADILLESAYFHPLNIRKSSQRLGLVTEASRRFERGVSMKGVLYAADRTCQLLQQYAEGKVLAGCLDVNTVPDEKQYITLREERVKNVLGTEIRQEEIKKILTNLDFEVEGENPFRIAVPSHRVDIEREIDLIEEVLRIYGFDNIESSTKQIVNIELQEEGEEERYFPKFREIFTGMGFLEVMTNSMVPGNRQKDFLPSQKSFIRISNPISEEMSFLRRTLIPSISMILERNKNYHADNVRIFEIGKVFGFDLGKEQEKHERWHIAGAMEGEIRETHWRSGKILIDFFDVKGVLENFLKKILLDNWEIISYDTDVLNNAFSITYQGKELGFFGRLPDGYLDIRSKTQVFVFELSCDPLIEVLKSRRVYYKPVSRFPIIQRDLVVLVDKSILVNNLNKTIQEVGGKLLDKIQVFDLYEGTHIPKGKKSVGFSLTFRALDRSLTEKEVDSLMSEVLNKLKLTFSAVLRER